MFNIGISFSKNIYPFISEYRYIITLLYSWSLIPFFFLSPFFLSATHFYYFHQINLIKRRIFSKIFMDQISLLVISYHSYSLMVATHSFIQPLSLLGTLYLFLYLYSQNWETIKWTVVKRQARNFNKLSGFGLLVNNSLDIITKS